MASTLGRCLLAAIPIGLIGWATHPWIVSLSHASVILRAGALFAVIGLAVVLFLLASWMLKIEGFNEFLGIVRRKMKGRVKK
jgi:membrane protein YdbS with pleckstrin-like domain